MLALFQVGVFAKEVICKLDEITAMYGAVHAV
jgi:hypothetical protein